MLKVKPDLANVITISRIMGVGVIFWFTPFVSEVTQLWTIVIYTCIALTDYLDGWIARRFDIVSELGKVLDPLADKILVLVFLPLLSMNAITAFPVFIIISREFAIMGLRVIAAKQGYIISANQSGKIKTAITLPICGILFARPMIVQPDSLHVLWTPLVLLKRWVHQWPYIVFEGLIWLTVVITIWSFLDYLGRYLWIRQLSITKGDREKAKKSLLRFIPNTVSFINVLCGIGSVLFSLNGFFYMASALILMGMILDGLDGRIARKLHVYSKFGETIDTKADYTTFGLAPAFLMYQVLSLYEGVVPYAYILSFCLPIFYFLSVAFRLNRFKHSGHMSFFQGIPSPVGAALVATLVGSPFVQFPYGFIVLNVLNIGLMISTFKYPHNESSNDKYFFNYLKMPVLVFIGLVVFKYLGVAILELLYVNEVLLGLMVIYYLSPIIPDKKNKNGLVK